MRTLLIGGALGGRRHLARGLRRLETRARRRARPCNGQADLWAIDQIEKNFHKATSKQDIDLMMSLWAPNATFTVGPGQTAAGTTEIRQFWLDKSDAFKPGDHWVSDHPAYKVEITVNGDRGTLHFECHYIDIKTSKVVRASRPPIRRSRGSTDSG